MDKEQILSTFKEKVGKTSLSEKTISDYIDAHLPAEGTEPDEAYWQRHTAFFKSLDGNYSADVAAQGEELGLTLTPRVTYIEGNRGDNAYIDLQLMTLCKGMIFCKSAFSYLAAVMSERLEYFVQDGGRPPI